MIKPSFDQLFNIIISPYNIITEIISLTNENGHSNNQPANGTPLKKPTALIGGHSSRIADDDDYSTDDDVKKIASVSIDSGFMSDAKDELGTELPITFNNIASTF